ncbi:MAG: metallophosphoesterase [Cyclobacteriaceae bacterium]
MSEILFEGFVNDLLKTKIASILNAGRKVIVDGSLVRVEVSFKLNMFFPLDGRVFQMAILKNYILLFPLFISACLVDAHAQNSDSHPLFSFGVIADVQYADVEQAGKRDYRGSIKRLEKSIEIFNAHELRFIIHAGDLIDRHYESFELPLGLFKKSRAPVHYVVGNHEFSVADSLKMKVRRLLNNDRGYYSLMVENFQFIIVDAMDVSLQAFPKDSRGYLKAKEIYQELKNRNANNAYDWNGSMGKMQLRWLKNLLEQGEKRGYKSILFSHLPLLPENGLQLWNNQEVLSLLNKYPSVIAFVSGHHHEGGYVKAGRIHHLTLKGLVESKSESACGVVDVYPRKLVVNGFGDQLSYTLEW